MTWKATGGPKSATLWKGNRKIATHFHARYESASRDEIAECHRLFQTVADVLNADTTAKAIASALTLRQPR